MKKYALIFAGGTCENIGIYDNIIENADIIVCADGGYKFCKMLKILPDIIIGDMDSIDEIPKYTETVTVKAEKDQTDTQLCIDYLAEKQYTDVFVIGALGGRSDHAFANMMLLVYAKKHGVNMTLLGDGEEAVIIDGYAEIQGETGDILSLFPIGGDCRGVSIKNVKYPLDGATVHYYETLGISNEIKNTPACISVKEGFMLAIRIFKATEK